MTNKTAASPRKAVSYKDLDRPWDFNVALSDVGEGRDRLCLEIPAGTRIPRRARGAGVPARKSTPGVVIRTVAGNATDRWEDDGGAGVPPAAVRTPLLYGTDAASGHPIKRLAQEVIKDTRTCLDNC